MKNLNQDIQASYQIIQLLEHSKENSESVIQNLPDLFMVVDEKATIYKANNEACRFLNLDQEQILGFHLNHKIPEDHWNILRSGFADNEDDKKTFELPLVYGGTERLFLWSVAKFGKFQDGQLDLYTLQARDITLLRLYQKKISDIFASIPLGIFTVNASGVIEDAFSEFTKWILGRSDIAGKTLKDLLFEPAKETMDVITREGFKAIWSSLNRGIREFDVLAETFPKVFFYPLPHGMQDNAGRYLGLKVQSIVKNERVMGLLIVIEDRTMIVEAEMMDEKSKLLQDRSIERALQLKKVDPELLTVSMNDMTQLFHDLGDCILTQSSDTFKNALHSIKANARLVGLTGLQKLAHSFETKLRESEDFSWEVVYTNMDALLHEWREIVALRKAIAAPTEEDSDDSSSNGTTRTQGRSAWRLYKDSLGDAKKKTEFEMLLKMLSKQPLGSVENTIRGSCSKAADGSGKRVNLIFDWDRDLELDMDLLTDIRVCLLHVINNAVDHGVEDIVERTRIGKNPTALIHVGSIHSKDGLILIIEDDGRGLDRDRIESIGVKRGLITPEQKQIFSEHDIFDLIFYHGFSTKEEVTDLSGRGVGLSAVREICLQHGGNCKVIRGPSGLTRFELHFVIQET